MTLPANGASETYEYDLSPNNTSRKGERGQSLLSTLPRPLGSDCGHVETAAHSIRWSALSCDESGATGAKQFSTMTRIGWSL